MRRVTVLSLIVGAVTILAALGPFRPSGTAGDQQQVVTINDLFSDVAKAAPAFGGMFYDVQGNLNVYLVDAGQRAAAQAAVAGVFGAERVPKDGIRVLPARYSFADLRAWQEQARSLFTIPGVLSSGIDHKANVLEVGVQDLGISGDVRRALQDPGIPEEAVRIKQTEPIVLQETLRDKVRPVEGGLNIDNNNCTLGYNARLGGVEGFVTASHCSANMGVVNGDPFHQTAIPADLIGHETVDPPFFLGLGFPDPCPLGWLCRWSDVAFAQYAVGVNFARGFIERTQNLNTPQIFPGNVNIVDNFQITATGVALVGNTVNKVGRSSGWTDGVVTAVCVDANMTTYMMLCQTEASYESAGGDSGAPVFLIPSPGTDNVTLVGNHWGGRDPGYCPLGCTDEGIPMTTTGIFSPFDQIFGELGPLTVTVPTPTPTPPPPVGGILEPVDVAQLPPKAAGSGGSQTPWVLGAGAAGGLLVIAAAGWYARRRWYR